MGICQMHTETTTEVQVNLENVKYQQRSQSRQETLIKAKGQAFKNTVIVIDGININKENKAT